MSSVEIKNVKKAYGNHTVIQDATISIPSGSFTVLIGPSGCGKSTLLRMIAGLEEITGGTISVGDRVINDVEPKDRDIAMVFQNYALYPHMTVAQNMGFSLRLARRPKAEIDSRVVEVSKILGLEPLLDRFPKQLSGGQRQRVAMGRAIVRNPKVFLFDEPLSNLDAKLRVQMRGELKQLHRRLGATTVYVTHDQIEAMTMGDRVVVMRDGNVEQVGHPLELYDSPENVFVASFIGSPAINLLEGVVEKAGEKPVLRLKGGQTLALPSDVAGLESGRAVTFGIRPEYIEQGGEGDDVEIDVTVVEPTGSDTHVVGLLGGETVEVMLRKRIKAAPDTKLKLRWDPEHVLLFDTATGRRLDL